MPEKKGKKTNKIKVVDGNDLDLWNSSTRDVKPLRVKTPRREIPAEIPATPAKKQKLPPEISVRESGLKATVLPEPQSVSGRQMSAQQKRKLTRGELSIDGRLDLHGMTRETAQKRLIGFIAAQYKKQHRCLLVITGKGPKDQETGKGQGVLRKELPFWLESPAIAPCILAVTPAAPMHGGTGAFYIYLRRNSG